MNALQPDSRKLRIAFVSYEYPPDSAYGGISTYVQQAVRMLRARGHDVEVFASSPYRSDVQVEDGVLVHRVQVSEYLAFSDLIAPIFAARHTTFAFDVLESPEYGADALGVLDLVPDIPLVVKLHTPTFMTVAGMYRGLPFDSLLRWALLLGRVTKYCGRMVRGRRTAWRFTWPHYVDRERLLALAADEVVAPSTSIANVLAAAWRLDPERLAIVPYPYEPEPELLSISPQTCTGRVTFIGRLEIRKGVLDLACAIPIVLSRHPQVRFRFVGASEPSHRTGVQMVDLLKRKLEVQGDAVEFTGAVASTEIPGIMADTDICVFPSVWENFANVCLESMSAGRGVVASASGGMADMLLDNRCGLTVPPCDHKSLAVALCTLIEQPSRRIEFGIAARQRVLDAYAPANIAPQQEASYRRAIARRTERGRRAR